MNTGERKVAVSHGTVRRRRRAASAAALVAMLALQGGWQDARDPAATLRHAVEREAARLRESLDAAERSEDRSQLVRRKLTVDATLVPLHLVRDALELAFGRNGTDILRSLRTRWTAAAPSIRWSHAGAEPRAQRSIARALGLGPDGSTRLRARVAVLPWTGTEAPPAVDWEIDGTAGEGGPVVRARCIRAIPACDPDHSGFPLPASGFEILWQPGGAAYADARGNHHAERWPADAGFDNPPEIYAVFDGLRLEASADRTCRPADTAAEERPSTPIESVRTIEGSDGELLRQERWTWEGDRLAAISWSQPALELVHRAAQSARVVAEAEGETVSDVEHRATSTVRLPPIEASLRFPEGAAGRAEFEMSVDGEPWAVGSIEHADARPGTAGMPVAEVEAAVARACSTGRAEDVLAACDSAEALLVAHELPPTQCSAERELLAHRLHAAGHASDARMLLASRWIRDLRAGEAGRAVRRWCDADEPSFAALLAEVAGLADMGHAATAGGPCGASMADPRSTADHAETASVPCEAAMDPERCAAFAACIAGAFPQGMAPPLTATALRSACCAACAEGAVPSLDAGALAALGIELQRALGAGLAPGQDATDAGSSARAVVEAAVDAARRAKPPEAVQESMRRAWRVIGAEAVATLRARGTDGAATEARRMLDHVERLLGNRFFPGFDAAVAGDPPEAGQVRAALEPRIAAAATADERRSETARRIVGDVLARAREDAAPLRLARTAVDAATHEYLRWAGRSASSARGP